MPDFLTTSQAATLLGISVVRVRQYITEGRLKATRFGKAYMIHLEDLGAVQVKPSGWPKGTKRGPMRPEHLAKRLKTRRQRRKAARKDS